MNYDVVVTVSFNPAIDTTVWLDKLEQGKENFILREICDSAGKAVNVSRVLENCGVKTTAVILAGEENSEGYFNRLGEESVNFIPVYTQGKIRENISLVAPDKTITRLMRRGFVADHEAVSRVLSTVEAVAGEHALIVVSGRLPLGMDSESLADFCLKLKARGLDIVLDTNSITMEDLLKVAPKIIKPNLEELEAITHSKLSNRSEILKAALPMLHSGIEAILVSAGDQGMLYVDQEAAYRVTVPKISVKSAVGAGDSMLAGFIFYRMKGRPIQDCIRYAAAFGTAACMVEGTNPPRKQDIDFVLKNTVAERIPD